MTVFISIMIGVAVGWILYLFFQKLEKEHLRAKWFATLRQVRKEGPVLAWNRPLIPLFLFLFRRPCFEKRLHALSGQLQIAGAEKILAPAEFLSWSFCLSIEGVFLTTLLFGFSFVSLLIGAVAGAGYPFLWKRFKKKEHWQRIRKDLPLVMDLLALSVGAGLDLMQAVQKMVQLLPATPLLLEFDQILRDLKLGHTRKEALLRFRERIPLSEIRQFIALLLQTIQLGSPLGPVLLANAEQMRAERFLYAEKTGVQASQKILFPLILCILPAIFLTIFAPLGIRFLTGGFGDFL